MIDFRLMHTLLYFLSTNDQLTTSPYVRDELDSDRPIILVANKVDLVRKRQVTAEEATELAAKYDCKYIETSATLNVKVDQLLVGVLKQIKLKLNPDVEETERADKETCTTGGHAGHCFNSGPFGKYYNVLLVRTYKAN